jgi:hypothetical protein
MTEASRHWQGQNPSQPLLRLYINQCIVYTAEVDTYNQYARGTVHTALH